MTRYLAGIEPKRVPLFAAAAVALAAAALVLYVVLPFAKSYRAALAEKATLERDTAAAVAVSEERAALQATVSALVAQAGDGSAWRSQSAVASAVIARIQESAARRGLELVGIEPSLGKRVASLQENLFEVELIGDYGDVLAYLRDARADSAPVVVREVSLSPLDEAPEPRIHATLVAAAFGDAQ